MLKLKLFPQAVLDIESIYEFTLKSWGYNQAVKYHDELYDCMITITKNPKIGSRYFF